MIFNFLIKQYKFLLFGLSTAFFASYGQTFFISIFNFQIRETLKFSNTEFGLIYSMATIISAFILVWFGRLLDKIDLRLYTFIISIGLAIFCFLMSILEYIPSIIFLIIFGLRFFGQGAMGHTSHTTMARYYEVDRGKAISFGSFGQPLGEMFLPLLSVFIIKFFGWHYTWLCAGLSIIIIYIPLYLFLLKNHQQRHQKFLSNQKNKDQKSNWNRKDVLKDIRFYAFIYHHT